LNIDFTRDTVSGHKIYLILDQDSVLLLTKKINPWNGTSQTYDSCTIFRKRGHKRI